MTHIKHIAARAVYKIRLRFNQWKAERFRQHWQAGKLGGGAMFQLGYITELKAVEMVMRMKDGPIVFIDRERGFIAFGVAGESPRSKSE